MSRLCPLRFALSFLIVVICNASTWPDDRSPPAAILEFAHDNCLQCHDSESHEGGLDLTSLGWELDDTASFDRWLRAFRRVESGEMPPPSEAAPEPAAKQSFLERLANELTIAERTRLATDGRAMKRRLNRYEYENAVRDLLHLPWIQIRDTLPEDGELYRFNKAGQALDVSHVQLSRYMTAADYALRQAMINQFKRPATIKKRFYARDEFSLTTNFWPRENSTLPDRHSFPVLDGQAQPDVRRGLAPRSSPESREREAVGRVSSIFSDAGGYSWGQFRTPASGKYKLRFKGYAIWVSGGGIGRWFYEGFGGEKAPVYHLPLWHRPNADEVWPGRRSEPIGVYAQSAGKSRPLGEFDFGIEPTECEIEVTLVANEVIQTDGLRLFRARVNGTDEQYVNPLATDAGMPGYAIQWMEVEGPFDDELTAAGYDLMFGSLALVQVDNPSDGGLTLQIPAQLVASSTEGNETPPQAPSRLSGPAQSARSAQPGRDNRAERSGPPRRGFNTPRFLDINVEVVSEQPRADAERLTRRFMERCYRRDVDPQHVARFLQLFDQQFALGNGFAGSMLTVYTAVLASPAFLFEEETAGTLDDLSLASRLALFLWNSVPDAELRQLARNGQLGQPDVLRAQVERLLGDEKAGRFIEAFTDYWLDLRKVDDTSPSTTLYNDYELDDPLKLAAIQETRLFVQHLITHNLPARLVVDSDFTFLNERLALHYGLPGVEGASMRLVQLSPDSLRGGLMTQASILKVTANGTTTSPVIRGNWISERLLGIKTEPPPAVPAVEPDIRGAVTIRQQLEQHRADASCAACHAKIDPPGLALESFDVMGGYRERYRAISDSADPQPGVGLNGQRFVFHYGLPVDCEGELLDGRTFQDVKDLKRLLLIDERQIASNLVEQLTTYATGAQVYFSDRYAMESILNQAQPEDYGLRALIHGIVQSDMFRNK
jgi:hypothetical protein